ncbi:regulatory protein, LuxR [Rhodobacterales bacterium HTCC2654]|uniref:Regulatory protein, LuxR n=2 Tax=Maritimibacter TaxID=404235 RepID=A3VED4_9RHOB|nr:regulatory protein, LuxR [Rhodobacterales bacterium HTCC2654] [Maritimibacter alkaliphilus HTCC2654]
MVKTERFFYLGVRFEPEATRAALPEALEPLDDFSGVVGMYVAPEGWGLAPLRGTFFGISVKGPQSPDGSPTVFFSEHVLGGPGQRIIFKDYNRRARRGTTDVVPDGAFVRATLDTQTGLEASIVLEPHYAEILPPQSGIHYYIGEAENNGLNIFSIAFTGRFVPSTVREFSIGNAASALMKSLQPSEVVWAMLIEQMPMTFSAPSRYFAGETADYSARAHQVGLMDLLSRIGHPAALVNHHGRTLFLTPEAQRILTSAKIGGKLLVWRRRDQQALDGAVSALETSHRLVSEPIAIERPEGALPILARALPVSSVLAGEPAVLILFSDPSTGSSPEAAALLQVLGLTPAEARLAATMASGRSARESGELIGVSENTARSTLKTVYDKLGISKQSELAGIVARLG